MDPPPHEIRRMNTAYALYALTALILAVLAHRSSALDFRMPAGALWPEPAEAHHDEHDYLTPETRAKAATAAAARRRAAGSLDRALLWLLAALAAAVAGGLLGFLGPRLIETLAAPAAPTGAALDRPRAPMELAALRYGVEAPLGRLAQIVGLIAGIALALRMTRIFIGLAALIGLVLAGLAAANFILARPLLALFGG